MKNILVPIDFSTYADHALEIAAQIAKKNDMGIVLFHMIGISESVLAKSELQEQEEANYYMGLAKKKLKEIYGRPYMAGLKIVSVIQNYLIFSEIDAVAAEQQASLIVMGSHGTSGLGTFFVGSNTEKVVRSSSLPVLVIKEQNEDFKVKEIVFACDLKPENASAYFKLKKFALDFNANIHLVFINEAGMNFKTTAQIDAKMAAFKEALGNNPAVTIYNDHSIEQGIFNFCKKVGADLLAIPTHGRRGLAHFFMGSLGETVANKAKIPVLTLKL
ncbi:MAG: universal stress protein [Croceitalea sp.]|nr:universal stress protein [Croceitalea sp.]MBT8238376.1 universal stress protein [Croceitalea sp.]NNC34015.1 universal stress protein [Croceitalea sp.]NNL09434.1 universal stress protein [Croceitalea sp.]NNM17339.1 universal stress protein [Croceitalea sp.]